MQDTSNYWRLVRLTSSGRSQIITCAIAQNYFIEQCLNVDSGQLQQFLFEQYQAGNTIARLCLRCYLSHCIFQECRSLVYQFSVRYQFTEADLLPFVLNDLGNLELDRFVPFSVEILERYKPAGSNLSKWAAMLVRQQKDLKQFFKEQGFALITNWAILNETKPKTLTRILKDYGWSDRQAAQATLILESYRQVYLSDRIAEGLKGKCADPTAAQLQRMANLINSRSDQTILPTELLRQLYEIAKLLRPPRIESLDVSEIARKVEQSLISNEPAIAEDFLSGYKERFLACLDQALQVVVGDRSAKFKEPIQAEKFLQALQLFHCQHLSMTAIAQALKMRDQAAVTRLLKLEQLRTDVKLHMLLCLKPYVLKIAEAYADPNQLDKLEQRIEAELNNQIDSLIEVAAKNAKTAKANLKESVFSNRLCLYLDQR